MGAIAVGFGVFVVPICALPLVEHLVVHGRPGFPFRRRTAVFLHFRIVVAIFDLQANDITERVSVKEKVKGLVINEFNPTFLAPSVACQRQSSKFPPVTRNHLSMVYYSMIECWRTIFLGVGRRR